MLLKICVLQHFYQDWWPFDFYVSSKARHVATACRLNIYLPIVWYYNLLWPELPVANPFQYKNIWYGSLIVEFVELNDTLNRSYSAHCEAGTMCEVALVCIVY